MPGNTNFHAIPLCSPCQTRFEASSIESTSAPTHAEFPLLFLVVLVRRKGIQSQESKPERHAPRPRLLSESTRDIVEFFMKALSVLGLVLSASLAQGAGTSVIPKLAWESSIADCGPADLEIAQGGQSYVTCQSPYGKAIHVLGYDRQGQLIANKVFEAPDSTSLLPRDLLLQNGILYLSYTLNRGEGIDSRLIAMHSESLESLWERDRPGFVGSNLVAVPDGGLWQLGLTDQRSADIAAYRYSSDGQPLAEALYDSGDNDSLGFDRHSGAPAPDSGLYVGGFSQVIRFDSQGQKLWSQDFAAAAIVSDGSGQLTVTNLRFPAGHSARFDAEGHRLWSIDHGGTALAVTQDGRVWIAGTKVSDATAQWDLRILALNDKGQLLLNDTYDGKLQDRAVDVAVDGSGNAYILASSFVRSGIGSADRYLTLKYDAASRRLWTFLYGRTGLPTALAVSDSGLVFALGYDGLIQFH